MESRVSITPYMGGGSETSLVKIKSSEIIKGNGGEVLRIRK